MSTPRVAVVVGNPKPRSRTPVAAQLLADAIHADRSDDGPALVVDPAGGGARLRDWSDTGVTVPLMLGAGEAHALFARDDRHAEHAEWLAANGVDVRARIAARVAARATAPDTSHPTLENRTEIPA